MVTGEKAAQRWEQRSAAGERMSPVFRVSGWEQHRRGRVNGGGKTVEFWILWGPIHGGHLVGRGAGFISERVGWLLLWAW
jgi:hypothetical protein